MTPKHKSVSHVLVYKPHRIGVSVFYLIGLEWLILLWLYGETDRLIERYRERKGKTHLVYEK